MIKSGMNHFFTLLELIFLCDMNTSSIIWVRQLKLQVVLDQQKRYSILLNKSKRKSAASLPGIFKAFMVSVPCPFSK